MSALAISVILLGVSFTAFVITTAVNYNSHTKQIKDLKAYVFHLYCLSEICGSSIETDVQRLLYGKMHDMNPLNGVINVPSMMRDIFSESYQKARNQIIGIMNATENQIIKNKMNEQLKDLDGIFNLLATIDKDSEQNYTVSVLRDVQMTMVRVAARMEEINRE